MQQKLLTKNFVLLILGQVCSLFGNYILRLALSMYVLEMTGSAAIFAGILSAAFIPAVLLSPFGGILADRANRKNIMVMLDMLNGIFVLCAVVFMNKGNAIVVISVLLAALSILGAFETPTVQACVPQMLAGDNIIKGNAVINQAASVSYLTAPMLGGIFYTAFGLKPVMSASVVCFFITALFECFIRLDYQRKTIHENVWSIIKNDFSVSMQFLVKKQPGILKMLFLAAGSRLFVMGITIVGLPYIVRNILGLSAEYYGAAESALAAAAILGSVAAGLLVGKLKIRQLSFVLAALGMFMIPGGIAFLLPLSAISKYIINIGAFCGVQIAVNIFSIFAVSMIQQKTPDQLLGKVMAYTSAVTTCVQPAGQIIYGFLFDGFQGAVYLVLIPTGVIVCMIGVLSRGFFCDLEMEQTVTEKQKI